MSRSGKGHRERLPEQRGGPRLVPDDLAQRGHRVERGRQRELVAERPGRRQRLAEQRLGRRHVPPDERRLPLPEQGVQPQPALRRLVVERQVGGEEPLALVDVAGEDGRQPGDHPRLRHEQRVTAPGRQRHRDGFLTPDAGDVADDEQQPHPPDGGAGHRGIRAGSADPVEPRQPLAGEAAQREVEPERAGELGGIRRRGRARAAAGRRSAGWRGRPRAGRARRPDPGPLERVAEGRRARQEVRGVGRSAVGGGDPDACRRCMRELPHRLEQPEPRLVVGSRHPQHERLVDERARERAARRRRRPRATGPTASSENPPLNTASRVKRSTSSGSRRSMLQSSTAAIVRCRSGRSRGPASSPVCSSRVEQGRRGEQPQARRRELEREGEAVEPAADRGQRGGVALGDAGRRAGRRGALEEQRDGGGGRPRSATSSSARRRQRAPARPRARRAPAAEHGWSPRRRGRGSARRGRPAPARRR